MELVRRPILVRRETVLVTSAGHFALTLTDRGDVRITIGRDSCHDYELRLSIDEWRALNKRIDRWFNAEASTP